MGRGVVTHLAGGAAEAVGVKVLGLHLGVVAGGEGGHRLAGAAAVAGRVCGGAGALATPRGWLWLQLGIAGGERLARPVLRVAAHLRKKGRENRIKRRWHSW